MIATYPEQGANYHLNILGGLWIIKDQNGGGYGIAAWYTPPEQQNRDFSVRDLQISTQAYADGCPSGCSQNWNKLDGNKVWTNVRKYNPGKADHGQLITP